MIKIIFLVSVCWIVIGGVFGLASFVVFDSILRNIFKNRIEAWKRLGMPIGFFWVPQGYKEKL